MEFFGNLLTGLSIAAFYSEESIREMKRRAAEGVSAVLLGKWPKVVVNKEVIGRTRASISGTFPG